MYATTQQTRKMLSVDHFEVSVLETNILIRKSLLNLSFQILYYTHKMVARVRQITCDHVF